ncbi:site-specific integrase [Pedobacter sp. SYSU D00535]|uniref:site-specific integrase n=1 Tax=Pedobacter sp. SYSU D00535 TaxID=2810308 RepID=UPI001A966417|nr:site-specific integrase [Pedobacter sp. SYSU D00535]
MKVTLRKRAISNGRKALYLDYYPAFVHPHTGKLSRREHLKIYIYDKPKDALEKKHNKETLALAENLRAKRQLEIQNKQFDFISDSKRNESFLEYFRMKAEKRRGPNYYNWDMSVRYLEAFAGSGVRFLDLNEVFCEEYKDYILSSPAIGNRNKKISFNTAASYYAKFRNVIKSAFKARLLVTNLYELVSGIAEKDTHREFLTISEFQKLASTECQDQSVKAAALFSGLTGLRFSDIYALRWSQVRGSQGDYHLQFSQIKTSGAQNLPISDQAYSLLGERLGPDQKVFQKLSYHKMRTVLQRWLDAAQISKKITFHCLRHTYATLQLASGTDIYTVSKMLGHKNVKTTQIYTKVIDDKKKEAANRIKLDLTN